MSPTGVGGWGHPLPPASAASRSEKPSLCGAQAAGTTVATRVAPVSPVGAGGWGRPLPPAFVYDSTEVVEGPTWFLGIPSWLWYIGLVMVANFGKVLFTEATYYFFMLARKVAKEEISRE